MPHARCFRGESVEDSDDRTGESLAPVKSISKFSAAISSLYISLPSITDTMPTARGTFEVKSSPQEPYDDADGVSIGRVSITKTFLGDITGSSTVEMIGARTPVKGSAGYVAIERVTGTLEAKSGSFVLQHSGTMNRGEASLTVTVVPDSGVGELAGLSGKLQIDIKDGSHFYNFDYSF